MTTFTADRAQSGFPVAGVGNAGDIKVAYGVIDVAANPVADDLYEMCRIPAGAIIVGGWFRGDRLDTHATETLDLNLGWAANGGSGTYDTVDLDGLGNLGVLTGDAFSGGNVSNVVAYQYPFNGVLVEGIFPQFTKETVIQISTVATAATFAAGSLSLAVHYVVEDY